MKRTCFSVICLVLVFLAARGQQNTSYTHPDALFFQGKACFSERKYAAASRCFEDFLTRATNAGQRIEADFYLAAAAYYLQSDEASARLEMHADTYPNTPFIAQVDFMRGMLAYREKRYVFALNYWKDIDENALDEHQKVDLLLYKGYALVETKHYEEANRIFSRLKDRGTRYHNAVCYYYAYTEYMLGRYNNARADFENLAELPQYTSIVPYYLTQIYYKEKNYTAVKTNAQKILSENPNNPNNAEIYRILGELSFEEKNYPAAISNLKNYERIFSQTLRSDMYLLGLAYFYTADYADAVQYLARVTNVKDSLSESAYFYLGNAYIKSGDKNNARMAYQAALSTHFNSAVREEAMYNYALTTCESGSLFGESVKAFENFLAAYPNSAHANDAYNSLAIIYLSTNDYQAALNSINKIKAPSAAVLESKQYVLYRLGAQEVAQNHNAAAIDNLSQAIDAAKTGKYVAEAYFLRSEAYYKTEQYDSALADLKAFFAQKPAVESENYLAALYNEAYIYFKQKKYTQAKDVFLTYKNKATDKKTSFYADALNRLGDCYFAERNFPKAIENYNLAATANVANADYAMFQAGYVLGLQKNYDAKIAKMDDLVKKFPKSEYAPQALFETGRACIMKNASAQAIAAYKRLTDTYPAAPIARKAALETGMVYANDGKTTEAIAAYKAVIAAHAGSEEAYAALDALEQIYIEQNEVAAFLAYSKTLGTMGARTTASYADSISYIAAEKRYFTGDYTGVIAALSEYVKNYCPGGRECINASYYLADSYYQTDNKTAALAAFDKLLEGGANRYTETAAQRCAEITYDKKDYAAARKYFAQLKNLAATDANRNAAQLGVLRCADFLSDNTATIAAATDLIAEPKASEQVLREAHFLRAKAYLATSEGNKATPDLQYLAQNTQDTFGAQASFLLAKQYFQEKNYDLAEKTIVDFIERGTPYPYWLARSMVLLAEISVAQGDDFQAKQYLLSLQANYTVDDDIQPMITEHLKAIAERENAKVAQF